MAVEADSHSVIRENDAISTETAADGMPKPPVKRSWRRKYRKMRAKFEDTISMSNQLVLNEWRAQGIARRLQEQNDQLLEILLSMNDTSRLPANHRYDLRTTADIESGNPAVQATSSPEFIQRELHELRESYANGIITTEDYTNRAEQLHDAQLIKPTHNLTSLEVKVAHTTEAPNPPIEGIDLTEAAPSYMSSAHEDEYLLAIDSILADPTLNNSLPDGRFLRMPSSHPPLTEKDLTVRNPNSVYNWLRKNQPQVFLQDKDVLHQENISEKSVPKVSNASNRGKRQSAVAGTPGPKTEHEEEELHLFQAAEAVVSTGKGKKSKAGEGDSAYRPKGGSSKPSKRKREDGDVAPKGSRKKNRVSAGVAN